MLAHGRPIQLLRCHIVRMDSLNKTDDSTRRRVCFCSFANLCLEFLHSLIFRTFCVLGKLDQNVDKQRVSQGEVLLKKSLSTYPSKDTGSILYV